MPRPVMSSGTGSARTEQPGQRDCRHSGTVHAHGTRAAYVADRCRCQRCREANRVEAAARTRAMAYGRWRPYADAAPARAHIGRLRAAGLGVNRIVDLSGVGSGTIRQLVYGDSRTGQPVVRIRPETEAAVLAVNPDRPARGALVPAAATHALIAELQEVGYALPVLARELGRTTASLSGTLTRARVSAATATAIADLHRRLTSSWQAALRGAVPGRAGSLHCGSAAEGVSGDPDDPAAADEVAVERAMAGEPVELTLIEQIEAVRRLRAKGLSVRRIAMLLGTSARTVSRRKAAGAVA